MNATPEDSRLLGISKANRNTLNGFKAGVHLTSASGRSIIDLQHQACADRLGLAREFLAAADRMMRSRPPMFRMALGRYYYAMYHTMRAVVYFDNEGDDHEAHSKLPTHAPGDFTQKAYWENELKDARLRRNEADYDPYPSGDAEFGKTAKHLRGQAHQLVGESTKYLKMKGCAHV